MWLFAQIFFYLLLAFGIGAVGSWLLRGRMAEQAREELQDRFRQMAQTLEMERDAAKLQVRELTERLEDLERRSDAGGRKAVAEKDPPGTGDGGESEVAASGAPDPEPLGLEVAEPAVEEAEVEEPDEVEPGVTKVEVAAPERSAPEVAAPEVEEAEVEEPEVGETRVAEPDPQESEDSASISAEPGDPESEVSSSAAPPLEAAEPADPGSTGEGPSAPVSGREAPEPGQSGHPLSDLGEVPPEASQRLREMGIHDTSALHRHFRAGADPEELAAALGVQPRRVRRWRALAELLEVPDLTPQNAWLLEISGLASIDELAAEDPTELVARMDTLNEDQALSLPVPDRATVATWIDWAAGDARA